MKRQTLYFIILFSMTLTCLAVYSIVYYSERTSLLITVCDKKLLITSEPGTLDYILPWTTWLVFALFTLILLYEILSSIRSIVALKHFAVQFRYVLFLLPVLVLSGLIFTANITSYPWKFFINGKEDIVTVSHHKKSFSFPLSDIACCKASVESTGRHRFLKIYVSLKNYPQDLIPDFTWYPDKGLEVFSHGVSSITDPSENANEINTHLSWYNINTTCR